jgi:signal peptidase I
MSTNDGGKGNGNGKNNNDDARYDPNPGGMSEWEEDDTAKDPQNNENFLDSLRSWIRSDEGREDIQTYTLSLCIALLLRLTIIEPRYIPSLSMYPTFDVGDQLAVEKVTKRIRPFNRNEVVVFNPPESFRQIMSSNYGVETKKSKEALIKRIVAIEGDEVKVRGGKLFVNDVKQDEPFTAEDAAYEFGPVNVPAGKVLVLGDNRNHSLDGHIWGFLPRENVIGRAVFIYWPPWRIGNEGMF